MTLYTKSTNALELKTVQRRVIQTRKVTNVQHIGTKALPIHGLDILFPGMHSSTQATVVNYY